MANYKRLYYKEQEKTRALIEENKKLKLEIEKSRDYNKQIKILTRKLINATEEYRKKNEKLNEYIRQEKKQIKDTKLLSYNLIKQFKNEIKDVNNNEGKTDIWVNIKAI